MKKQILEDVLAAAESLGLAVSPEDRAKIEVTIPDPAMGDYSSNAALILAKGAKQSPRELAVHLIEKLEKGNFAKVESAGPGFINFKLSPAAIMQLLKDEAPAAAPKPGKILVEYFQPNIAKPLHIGHLRTAIIGDSLVRMLKYLGHDVESDTHMGDWGTQFGLLILAYKKYGNDAEVAKDPIGALNSYYIKINQDAEADPAVHEAGKQEFVKLESGDEDSRQIWKRFVDWSM